MKKENKVLLDSDIRNAGIIGPGAQQAVMDHLVEEQVELCCDREEELKEAV